MTNNHSKGRAIALLPIAVFLLFFIGSGLITGDFYSMPAIVGFLIALIIAFLQNKNLSFVQKLRLASTGVGDENIFLPCASSSLPQVPFPALSALPAVLKALLTSAFPFYRATWRLQAFSL